MPTFVMKNKDMEYIGEHLFIGTFGQTAIYISLFAALVSAVLFFVQKQDKKFNSTARSAFLVHLAGVVTACAALFVMLANHYFEYNYVWQYTSVDLPGAYIFSAFWAGKEGSLLAWLLFQAILGCIVMFSKKATGKVMGVISSGQFLLNLLIAGISIGSYTLGQSPFILLRNLPEYASMPLFSVSSYLSFLTDGNGMNPLLQNPWMAIHPPILFLGYAACLIPYAYAVASIVSLKEKAIIKIPVFWMVFSAFTLGAGLLLGGAWAYEDLTFGGFWSWDPVENASLIPWLLVIAGLHFLLPGRYRRASEAFAFLPYVLVLFASYLTRSGVLSNASAHSFSGGQGAYELLFFTGIFLVVPFVLMLRFKKNSHAKSAEYFLSREFWMFIGAIIIVLSAFQILFVTSVPALNHWFGLNIAPPVERISFYNGWQQWFGMGAALMIAATQFLVYGKNELRLFFKKMLFSAIIAFIVTICIAIVASSIPWPSLVFLFTLLFVVFASLDSLLRNHTKKFNIAATITHLGVGVFFAGVVLTFTLQEYLSTGDDNEENAGQQILVLGKIEPLKTGFVSYAGREKMNDKISYRLDFLHKAEDGNYYLDFSLLPSLTEEKNMGPVFFPDTRKSIKEDVFVHLTHAEITSDEYSAGDKICICKGDTVSTKSGLIALDSIRKRNIDNSDSFNISIKAYCRWIIPGKGSIKLEPEATIINDSDNWIYATCDSLGLQLRFDYSESADTAIITPYTRKTDYIIIRASIFPFINIMWIGAIIMEIGFILSLTKRFRKKIDPEIHH
jgi:cytochrome c-type biogenesis protein CcmF